MKAIGEIIAMEWEMFQKVNEGGPRASCQEDKATFEGMRRGSLKHGQTVFWNCTATI